MNKQKKSDKKETQKINGEKKDKRKRKIGM
jgi:hypothetical protein